MATGFEPATFCVRRLEQTPTPPIPSYWWLWIWKAPLCLEGKMGLKVPHGRTWQVSMYQNRMEKEFNDGLRGISCSGSYALNFHLTLNLLRVLLFSFYLSRQWHDRLNHESRFRFLFQRPRLLIMLLLLTFQSTNRSSLFLMWVFLPDIHYLVSPWTSKNSMTSAWSSFRCWQLMCEL